MPLCDLVVGTEEEIRIAGGSDDVLTAIRGIRARTAAPIVIKRGATGCTIVAGAVPDDLDEAIVVPGFPVEVLNVLGAGDAFLSGFLYGWLRGASLDESGRLGNACGALVVSRHGCTPAMPSQAELAGVHEPRPRQCAVRISTPHRAHASRDDGATPSHGELFVLAFDHRRQLEQLADELGKPRAAIARFKKLIAAAVDRVAADSGMHGSLGVIVDARHGTPVLEKLAHSDTWIARPIELPGSRPLAFDGTTTSRLHIRTWPAGHVIKCLVFYHPDDPIELRYEQEQAVRELYRCRAGAGSRPHAGNHLQRGAASVDDDTTFASSSASTTSASGRPGGSSNRRPRPSWRAIGELIAERDPWCNGIAAAGSRCARRDPADLVRGRRADADLPWLRGRPQHLQRGRDAGFAAHWPTRQRSRTSRALSTTDRSWLTHRHAGGNRRNRRRADMGKTVRLTMSQALVRYLIAQQTVIDGKHTALIPGVFAIFGHGNVAALGEALAGVRDRLPTYRAHNEQAMAHAAIAYAKANRRRRFMACTTSIGPGATNMVTAAAVAHVNRLPVLLLPGDVFASRRPDPVLQQVEDFGDPTVTANDCFRPVSRYWDRITRPEQLLRSLPQAISVLTDPAECGPVTLALPQDVQAEA